VQRLPGKRRAANRAERTEAQGHVWVSEDKAPDRRVEGSTHIHCAHAGAGNDEAVTQAQSVRFKDQSLPNLTRVQGLLHHHKDSPGTIPRIGPLSKAGALLQDFQTSLLQ
jgi:hypothetical protein